MADAEPGFDLTCWYLNLRRVAELVGPDSIPMVPHSATAEGNAREKFRFHAEVKNSVVEWIAAANPPTLGQLIARGELRIGQLFTHYGRYYCRGLPKWSGWRTGDEDPAEFPEIHAKLDELGGSGSLRLRYHPEHLVSTSAWATLTGQARLFALGLVDSVSASEVSAYPFVVATPFSPRRADASLKSQFWSTRLEVFADQIDAFSRVRDHERPPEADLKLLRSIPESEIKNVFAELIGEEHVPKDWGGERSDLFSSAVRIDGRRISTAFAFKGPAHFRELKMAGLGKNGDQIDRLFSEPADLLVLQHCHRIAPAVRNTMRAFASQMGNLRAYCVIDGLDTLRILRAYKRCGLVPE